MKKIFILLCFIFIASFSRSQETIFEDTEVLYFSEMAGGLIIHTNGWGLNFIYAENISGFRRRLYEAEIVGMRDSREIKTLSDFSNIRGYFYGKLNTLTILRTSIGKQNTFIPKQSIKGVSISYDFNYGISHGFVKPVYLSIAYSTEPPSYEPNVRKEERYDPERHFPDRISGRASYFKGFDEIKYYPGLFAKFGLNFDYGTESDLIKAIEVGVTADAFYKEVPMMAFTENNQVFFTAYLNFLFGKRKTVGDIKEKRRKHLEEKGVLE